MCKLEDSDPHLVATEARIAALDKIVKDAREWSRDPSRRPFKQFMEEHEIDSNRRDFDALEKLEAGNEFRFHSPFGPIELLCGVMRMEQKPKSIVVISDLADLTPVPPAVGEMREFDWPRVGREVENGLSIASARMFELVPKIADHITEKMSDDGIVVGWTRQTETAAFEKILDRLEESGLDPRIVIGSPEGTFTGRVSAIRLALGNAPALPQAASGPALR